MERNGWRAIIYDAPWARFKTGQKGVIVSEDGKSCETTDNDKSNIIVVADFNYSSQNEKTGHILFRQKGSDLYDIVCLRQTKGGTYKLEVNGVTINGCEGKDYVTFVRELVVFETYNDIGRVAVTDYNTKLSMLVSPTQNDFITHNNFKNETDKEIYYDIEISKNGASASATITSTTAEEEYEEYKDTVFNGLDNITICKSGGGSYDCIIENIDGPESGEGKVTFTLTTVKPCGIYPNNDHVQCEGGTFTFSVNQISDCYIYSDKEVGCQGGEVTFSAMESGEENVYKIDFSELEVYEEYDIKQCGTTIRTITSATTVSYSLVEQEGVRVISVSGNIMLISADGVDEVEVKITTDRGESKNKKLEIPSELCQ